MRAWSERQLTATVRSFLRHIAIPAVWTSYSLRGVRGKKQFDSLKVYKLLNGKYSYILYISLFITTMIMITG